MLRAGAVNFCYTDGTPEISSNQAISADSVNTHAEHSDGISYTTTYATDEGPDLVHLPAAKFNAVIAIREGEVKISKDSSLTFEGFMPSGAMCFMSPGKAIFLKPKEGLSLVLLNFSVSYALRRQSEICPQDIVGGASLGDFNLRWDDCRRLATSLVAVSTKDRASVAAALVDQALVRGCSRSRVCKLPWWRLRKVRRHILANIGEENSLRQLAEVAGLSRMHFAAQFRAATCLSPHESLLRERMEHAKKLLSIADCPIADIALQAGFQNQAHFSTVFKRLTGTTPAAFRKSRPRESLLVAEAYLKAKATEPRALSGLEQTPAILW